MSDCRTDTRCHSVSASPLRFSLPCSQLWARLTAGEGLLYAALVCSPAALMAIERGNERLRDAGISVDPLLYSAVAVVIAISVALFVALRVRLPDATAGAREKMLIGCGIYCGSFILLSNFNYRLIFLLLVVPQLIAWRAQRGRARRFAVAALLTVAVALLPSGQLRSWLFLLKESANWLIFAGATCVLLQAAIDWLRDRNLQPASNSPSAAGSFTGA